MPVLEKGQRRTHTGQFWAHAIDDRPWNGPAPPAVAYVYARGRGHREIKDQLAGYHGLLQVDGYAGYTRLASRDRLPGQSNWLIALPMPDENSPPSTRT